MKIIKQPITLKIESNVFNDEDDEKIKRHGILFPSVLRCIIVGPSNCGKTNAMLNLVEHVNGLTYENVYVYSKSLYQPKYVYLEKLLKPLSSKDWGVKLHPPTTFLIGRARPKPRLPSHASLPELSVAATFVLFVSILKH